MSVQTLLDVQDAAGARRGEDGTPLDFGDPAEEDRAFGESAALVDLSSRALLDVGGRDRLRFLNGQVTNDVARLAPGQGLRALCLDAKGHILFDLCIHARTETLLLQGPAGVHDGLREHLDRSLFREDVRLEGQNGSHALLGLLGPRAASLLETIELPGPPAELGLAAGTWEGTPVEVLRHDRLGLGGFDLVMERPRAGDLWSALVALGARPAGHEAFELRRIEAGRPCHPLDFGASTLPQETGLEDVLSFDKGCYVGQEVVARIATRGHVNRRLACVRLQGAAPGLPPGRSLLHDGRRMGRLGSSALSPRHGAIGFALVHRRLEAPGTRLALEDGSGEVEVLSGPCLARREG